MNVTLYISIISTLLFFIPLMRRLKKRAFLRKRFIFFLQLLTFTFPKRSGCEIDKATTNFYANGDIQTYLNTAVHSRIYIGSWITLGFQLCDLKDANKNP